MNNIAIKKYDIDYSFIIKNYLNKELWHKEWNLFVFKDIVVTLSLNSIEVYRDSIAFKIETKKGTIEELEWIYFYTKNETVKHLKNKINGAVFRTIEDLEQRLIRQEAGYKTIKDASYEEEQILEEVANNFLDDEGVTNKEIRDVYIDNYVSNNSKTETYLSNYVRGRQYCVLSDLYLTFTRIINDDKRYDNVLKKIQNEGNYLEILKEVDEFVKQLEDEEKLEELTNEYKESLEAI